MYNSGAQRPCELSPLPQHVFCCSHFCERLEGKTEINPGTPGQGPFCNGAPERRTGKEACESAYWTREDGQHNLCRFEPAAKPFMLRVDPAVGNVKDATDIPTGEFTTARPTDAPSGAGSGLL